MQNIQLLVNHYRRERILLSSLNFDDVGCKVNAGNLVEVRAKCLPIAISCRLQHITHTRKKSGNVIFIASLFFCHNLFIKQSTIKRERERKCVAARLIYVQFGMRCMPSIHPTLFSFHASNNFFSSSYTSLTICRHKH